MEKSRKLKPNCKSTISFRRRRRKKPTASGVRFSNLCIRCGSRLLPRSRGSLPQLNAGPRPTLKRQLERKLDGARIIHGLVDRLADHPKTAGRTNVLFSSARDARQEEMRVVKEIEELSPELQIHSLANRQGKVLDYRKIRVYITRTVGGCAVGVSQFSGGRFLESAGIKPIGKRVNLSGRDATRIGCDLPRLVGIANFVRALQNQPVVEKEHTRLIGAVDHKKWEARLCPFNQVYLPVSQQYIGSSAPIAAEVLALAKRQVVKNARGKDIIQIKLGQTPIQPLSSR